jgi:3-dehydroquinate dehydratase II
MRILVLNGPNLNLLGKRNQTHYGSLTLEKIEQMVTKEFQDIMLVFFQSNKEGELIEKIQTADNNFDAIVINPGGYAHSSVAIRDALEIQKLPKIEVHLSHLVNRENFRQNLITASGCDGYISGFKEDGYFAAIYLAKKIINDRIKKK